MRGIKQFDLINKNMNFINIDSIINFKRQEKAILNMSNSNFCYQVLGKLKNLTTSYKKRVNHLEDNYVL